MRLVSARRAVWAAVLIFGGLSATPALAHRVNIFAYVEGDTVHVDCSYNKNDRVHFGDIEVKNAATGERYLTGKTDENGAYVFQIPAAARAAKADLQILLKAGEGHQNDWIVEAKEYLGNAPAAAGPPAAQAPTAAPASVVSQKPAAPAPAVAAAPQPAMTPAAVQAVVEAAVEKKIAPLRKILVEDKEKGPGVTEIAGGIGYLVGIAGLLAYARSRSGRTRA